MYIWQMSRDLVNEIYKMMSVCKDYVPLNLNKN